MNNVILLITLNIIVHVILVGVGFNPIALLIAIIFNFILIWAVYKDAKRRNVNENWWIAVLILGWIGALIYYLINKNK